MKWKRNNNKQTNTIGNNNNNNGHIINNSMLAWWYSQMSSSILKFVDQAHCTLHKLLLYRTPKYVEKVSNPMFFLRNGLEWLKSPWNVNKSRFSSTFVSVHCLYSVHLHNSFWNRALTDWENLNVSQGLWSRARSDIFAKESLFEFIFHLLHKGNGSEKFQLPM